LTTGEGEAKYSARAERRGGTHDRVSVSNPASNFESTRFGQGWVPPSFVPFALSWWKGWGSPTPSVIYGVAPPTDRFRSRSRISEYHSRSPSSWSARFAPHTTSAQLDHLVRARPGKPDRPDQLPRRITRPPQLPKLLLHQTQEGRVLVVVHPHPFAWWSPPTPPQALGCWPTTVDGMRPPSQPRRPTG
jgi:hypothetical protein